MRRVEKHGTARSWTGRVGVWSIALVWGSALAFSTAPAAACSVCFGASEDAGPIQAAIVLLLLLVLSIQLALARFLWRLVRRGEGH